MYGNMYNQWHYPHLNHYPNPMQEALVYGGQETDVSQISPGMIKDLALNVGTCMIQNCILPQLPKYMNLIRK